MAKNKVQQAPVRKPLLIFGGVAVGVALVAFVLMNFVGGGGSGEAPVTSGSPQAGNSPNVVVPAPAPQEAPTLREGGRNPFQPVVNLQASAASAPEPAAEPEPPAPTAAPAASTEGSRYVALVEAGTCQALPAGEPHTLEEVIAHQNECLAANPQQ